MTEEEKKKKKKKPAKKPKPKKKVSPWKQKYLKEFRAFEKRREKAKQRGFILPEEFEDIGKAKGGYRQAYEKLHKLSQIQLQRQSKYQLYSEGKREPEEVTGAKAMNIARKRFASWEDFQAWQEELREEATQIWDEEEEEEEGAFDWIPDKEKNEEEFDKNGPPEDEMGADDTATNIIEEVKSLLDTFQNVALRERLKSLLSREITKPGGYPETAAKLESQRDDVIGMLQEATELPYPSAGYDDELNQDIQRAEEDYCRRFEEMLTGRPPSDQDLRDIADTADDV